jgi:hypothetical protein
LSIRFSLLSFSPFFSLPVTIYTSHHTHTHTGTHLDIKRRVGGRRWLCVTHMVRGDGKCFHFPVEIIFLFLNFFFFWKFHFLNSTDSVFLRKMLLFICFQ